MLSALKCTNFNDSHCKIYREVGSPDRNTLDTYLEQAHFYTTVSPNHSSETTGKLRAPSSLSWPPVKKNVSECIVNETLPKLFIVDGLTLLVLVHVCRSAVST